MLQTHTLVAGATGSGKTVAAQAIVEEALLKGVSTIVFDPTAQWTGFLRSCKTRGMLRLYPLFGMKNSDARAFNGNVYTLTDPKEHVDIKKYINPGEITIFCLHKMNPEEIDVLVETTVKDVFRANLEETSKCRLLIVYDEVHRLLPKFGGSGRGFIQIERAAREFRKWGVGLVLISQVLSDFVGEIKANIGTEVQMRTRYERDLERIKMKYGEDTMKSVVKANVGTGMVQNAEYNQGRPYFISFRPLMHDHHRLSDEVLEKYDKYNKRIEILRSVLDEMKTAGVDVFDLSLELGLTLDNVKKGSFDVVELYIDSLEPRIEDQYNKLTGEQKQRIEEVRRRREDEKRGLADEEGEYARPRTQLGVTEAPEPESPEAEEDEEAEKRRGLLDILTGIDKEIDGIESEKKSSDMLGKLQEHRENRRRLWDKMVNRGEGSNEE